MYKGRFIFFPLAACGFIALIGYVVMLLWNNILPEVLGVNTITFWQATGIFVLCKILFGFGKGGGGRFREKMMQRRLAAMNGNERSRFDWANCLTEEQREKLRKKMEERRHCGWGPFSRASAQEDDKQRRPDEDAAGR